MKTCGKIVNWLQRREEGNVMILGAFLMIVCVLFMALIIDMGLYFGSYRKLRMAADAADEKVGQMMAYFLYAPDYQAIYDESILDVLTFMGYDSGNIVEKKITRTRSGSGSNGVMHITTTLELEDTFQCILLPIVGIDTLEIKVSNNKIKNMGVDHPYTSGKKYKVWGTDEEGTDIVDY